MALYGYARVSTLDQNLGIQRAALKAAGCDVIRAEKASGTRRDGRTELQVLLDFLRPGDALVITRIDRLARSLKDLQDIVHELKERRVALRATEQPINTGTAAGKAFLGTDSLVSIFCEAIAGGAVLALVVHAMIPEAIHEGRSRIVRPAVAGCLAGLYRTLDSMLH